MAKYVVKMMTVGTEAGKFGLFRLHAKDLEKKQIGELFDAAEVPEKEQLAREMTAHSEEKTWWLTMYWLMNQHRKWNEANPGHVPGFVDLIDEAKTMTPDQVRKLSE